MIKKLDKLIIKLFSGPFLLTFAVVLFIFLTQYMIKNLKHFVGKGLGLEIYAELFGYFSLVLTPVALPLSVLLSTLMTFGSLGEHSELTAIKSSGISLLRILRPIMFVVILITGFAFYFNDQISPWANLKAYSLLYDIKQKKPVLEFKEEVFYKDMPGYSIKIGKKYEETEAIEDVMIYNHSDRKGNVQVILAESGYMRTIGEFLVLDLRNGSIYSEESAKKRNAKVQEFFRQRFDSATFKFSLESYGLRETKEEFFKGHNLMKTTAELFVEKDSAMQSVDEYMANMQKNIFSYYSFWEAEETYRSTKETGEDGEKRNLKKELELEKAGKKPKKSAEAAPKEEKGETFKLAGNEQKPQKDAQIQQYRMQKSQQEAPPVASTIDSTLLDSIMTSPPSKNAVSRAFSRVGSLLNVFKTNHQTYERQAKQINFYRVDLHRKFTKTMAVFVMFLIGAPLGAIIKKGGLGVPVLISIIFFVIFYISTIMGEKYAKEMVIPTWIGCWLANMILFAFGLFFLRQARADARLFDLDYYYVLLGKVKELFGKREPKSA